MLKAGNIATKSISSVMMNIHMPRVALSRCCSGVANCSRKNKLDGSAKVQLLPLRLEVICLPGDHRRFFKVVRDRGRCRLPFKTRSAPGVIRSGLSVFPGPDEIDEREDIAHAEDGSARRGENIQE